MCASMSDTSTIDQRNERKRRRSDDSASTFDVATSQTSSQNKKKPRLNEEVSDTDTTSFVDSFKRFVFDEKGNLKVSEKLKNLYLKLIQQLVLLYLLPLNSSHTKMCHEYDSIKSDFIQFYMCYDNS